jgi:hypothetical protein
MRTLDPAHYYTLLCILTGIFVEGFVNLILLHHQSETLNPKIDKP